MKGGDIEGNWICDRIIVFTRKGENFIGLQKAPGHGIHAVLTRGRKLDIKVLSGVSGIEIFGGYLPVYHDR